MTSRKFFKSERSLRSIPKTNNSEEIIQDFILSNDENGLQPQSSNKRKHPIDRINDDDDDFMIENENSESNDSEIDEDFEFDNINGDFFEPIFFRSSTPNHEIYSYEHESQSTNESKVDLWEKALTENESLREWVKNFDEHIEKVDNSEMIIVTTKR